MLRAATLSCISVAPRDSTKCRNLPPSLSVSNPHVIVAVSGRAALALKAATATVPIVMATSADAVSQGLVSLLTFGLPLRDADFRIIANFAREKRLATMSIITPLSDAGMLMFVGPNFANHYRQVAAYVAKILRGGKPADLPVEQPTKVDLVINMKTAKALGLTIPQSLLLRADHVIE
jgi:putative tryptophan/tyrosine transport system substrate-binding protein